MADHRRSIARSAVVWDALAGRLEACRASLTESRPLDVLDLGGGTGGFAVRTAELGHRVIVVDPNPDALALLGRRADEAGVSDRIQGLQGDSTDLVEVAGSAVADVVLCHDVLEVVDSPREALRSAAETLRPGGTLSLLVTGRYAAALAKALAGHLADARRLLVDPDGRWGSVDPVPRRFTEDEVTSLLDDAGFELLAVHGARVFVDLIPSALVDSEPGATEELLKLEADVADRPEFRAIATQLHALAVRR